MKYSCGLIRDLLPLYCDGVCGEDSAQAVREHIEICDECRGIYEKMRQPESGLENSEAFEQRQMNSMREVKKKMQKKNRIFGVAGIVVGVVVVAVVLRILLGLGVVSLLVHDVKNSPIIVYDINDIRNYQDLIGARAIEPYKGKWGMDESIFPETDIENLKVRDFKFVYYNPWDAQYVAYLTVEYSEEDYRNELSRLAEKGMEDYVGFYGVMGAPAGYEMLAMDSDEYYGFVYAMTPGGEETSVTYVMIVFCNYFLDLDINDYVPREYLLQDFDASVENPYRAKMLKK